MITQQDYMAYYSDTAYSLSIWSIKEENRIKAFKLRRSADRIEYKYRKYNSIHDNKNFRKGNYIIVPKNPKLDQYMEEEINE